jgi:TonB family protein
MLLVPGVVSAQLDSSRSVALRCDSAIRAAHVDSVESQVRAYLLPTESENLREQERQLLLQAILTRLQVPTPLQLPVFAPGPVALRMLKPARTSSDSVALRAPVVYGVYDFRLRRGGTVDSVRARVETLVPGLDSSVVAAIRGIAGDPVLTTLSSEVKGDPMRLEFRISSLPADSRIRVRPLTVFTARFPRIALVDAEPSPSNLAPVYPDEERADGDDGEVVVRAVVDATGAPVISTMEVIRATSPAFALSALRALAGHRYAPAHVGACGVPQAVEIPFWFSLRP